MSQLSKQTQHVSPNTKIQRSKLPDQLKDNSIQGFGWTFFNNQHIPYIIRHGEKLVSLPLMRCKIFDHFQKYFTVEFYRYFTIYLKKMTESEAKLLSEITRSDVGSLSKVNFNTGDVMISLNDGMQIYEFMNFSFERLICKRNTPTLLKSTPCGFVKINNQNCIPYVHHAYKTYVPLFYIDGDCNYLQEMAEEMKGWPLAYLKLCCKIHGVQKPIYKDTMMTVVDMELVKKYYPPDTSFEEFWPHESYAQSLIVSYIRKTNTSRPQNINIEPPRPCPNSVANNCERNRTIRHRNETNGNAQSTSNSNPIGPPPPYPNTNEQSTRTASNDSDTYLNCRRLQIPHYEIKDHAQPYSILKVPFYGTHLQWAVNMFPCDFNTKLAAVGELVHLLQVPLRVFLQAIEYLDLKVYLPNSHQRALLVACRVDHALGLLEVNTVMERMSDIRKACLQFHLRDIHER